MAPKQEPFIAYALTEIGRDRTVWDRIGVAYLNKDGSINVQLRAIPLSGKIQLRHEAKDEPETTATAPEPETAA